MGQGGRGRGGRRWRGRWSGRAADRLPGAGRTPRTTECRARRLRWCRTGRRRCACRACYGRVVTSGLQEHPVAGADQSGPMTLAIDIGGTGLKASVLDATAQGRPAGAGTDAVPVPAPVFIRTLDASRTSCRRGTVSRSASPALSGTGTVLTAPNLSTERPGHPHLAQAHRGVGGLPAGSRTRGPARHADAPVQRRRHAGPRRDLGRGLRAGDHPRHRARHRGVSSRHADTPPGTRAHAVPRRGTFQDQLGNQTRRRIGNRRWSKRVLEARRDVRPRCISTGSTSAAATPRS